MFRPFKNAVYIYILIQASVTAMDNITNNVDYIEAILQQQRVVLDEARGKEITVVLGNTGSGKSTLANLIADVPLHIDSYGHIATNTAGFKIDSGTHSITKLPTFLQTKIGMVWDCPGFIDTEGAVPDVLTAALIRDLLTKASLVKAIFVTSVAETEAARGKLYNALLKTIGIFNEQFVKSCLIVINKVESEVIDTPNWLHAVFENADEIEKLKCLCNEVIPLRKTRVTNNIDVLFGDRDNLIQAINSIKGCAVPSVNISLAFGVETGDILITYFTLLSKKTLEQKRQEIYENVLGSLPMTSENVHLHQENCWNMLVTFIGYNPNVQLIRPFAQKQAEIAFNNFKETFVKEHIQFVQHLQLSECEETIRRNEEEIKRLNNARQENERRVREENIQAEKFKKDIASVEERAKKALDEAEKLKGDVSKNKKQVDEALTRAAEALKEKNRLEKEAETQRILVQNAERERQETLAQIAESRNRLKMQEEKFERERALIREKADQDIQKLRSQLDQLNGRLGQVAQLEAQLNQFRTQIAQVTPSILAANQRILERNNRIASGRGRGGHHHHGHGGHHRVPWPVIPWPWSSQ